MLYVQNVPFVGNLLLYWHNYIVVKFVEK